MNHTPRAPTPNGITLGIRFSTYEFGGRGVEGIQTFRPQHWIRKISSFQSL